MKQKSPDRDDLVHRLRNLDPHVQEGDQKREKLVLFSFVDKESGNNVSVYRDERDPLVPVKAMVFHREGESAGQSIVSLDDLSGMISPQGVQRVFNELKQQGLSRQRSSKRAQEINDSPSGEPIEEKTVDDNFPEEEESHESEAPKKVQTPEEIIQEAEQDIAEGAGESVLSEEENEDIGRHVLASSLEQIDRDVVSLMDDIESNKRRLKKLEDSFSQKQNLLQRVFSRLPSLGASEDERASLKETIQADRKKLLLMHEQRKEKAARLAALDKKKRRSDASEIQKNEVERTNVFFQKEFGISKEELASFPEFQKLSDGKKRLLFENMRYATLGRLDAESRRKITEEESNADGFFRRIWLSFSRSARLEKTKRLTVQEFRSAGMESHGEVLRNLLEKTKNGPDASFGVSGKLNVDFFSLSAKEFSLETNDAVRDASATLNTAARKLSEIPYEWSFPDASAEHRELYQQNKKEYEKSRDQLLQSFSSVIARKKETGIDLKDVLVAINETDTQIELRRMVGEDSELERRFYASKNPSLWRRISTGVFGEHAGYFAFGILARSVVKETLGWIAAPAVCGAIFSGMRANQQLKENAVETRYGGKVRSEKETKKYEKNFVSVESLIRKLEDERKIIEKEFSIDKESPLFRKMKFRAEAARRKVSKSAGEDKSLLDSKVLERLHGDMRERLRARVDYTRRKLVDGLIAFGDGDEQFLRQLSLLQELSRAEVILSSGNQSVSKALSDRVSSVLDTRKHRIDRAKWLHIVQKTSLGALTAGAFSYAGALFSDGIVKPALDRIDFEFPKIESFLRSLDDAVVSLRQSLGLEPASFSEPALGSRLAVGEITSPTTIPDVSSAIDTVSYEYKVSSGGSVWKGLKEMMLSDSRFEGITTGELNTLVENTVSRLSELPKETLAREYGITSGDLAKIRSGQTLHLGKVFEDFPEVFEALLAKRGGN